jgi:hypothetical protein
MQHGRNHRETGCSGNKLWFTSDNLAFFEEKNAINHSLGLADKTIKSKTKAEVESELEGLVNDSTGIDIDYIFQEGEE